VNSSWDTGRRPDLAEAGPGEALRLDAPVLPRVGEHPGFTLTRVSLVLVAALFGLAVVRLPGAVGWVVLVILVGWCITWAHPLTALAAAAETWALGTGFAVHRYGELTFTWPDLGRLLAVSAALLLVCALTRRLRPG